MFENATTVKFQPGKLGEALLILREDIAPVLLKQKGIINLCVLPHRDTDMITVISLWDSQAHAFAVEAVCAYRKEVKKLDALLAPQPFDAAERIRAA